MSFFIILDADYPPANGNFTFVASNPNLVPLLQKKTFDPTECTTVPQGSHVFSFVVSHDMQDVTSGALVPAAIYNA